MTNYPPPPPPEQDPWAGQYQPVPPTGPPMTPPYQQHPQYNPNPPRKRRWPLVLVLVLAFLFAVSMCSAALSGGDDEPDAVADPTTTVEQTEEPTTEEPTTEEPTEDPAWTYDESVAELDRVWNDETDTDSKEAICKDVASDGVQWVVDSFNDTDHTEPMDDEAVADFFTEACEEVNANALTVSQEQAIASAESYLEHVPGWSREGLIGQLEYEEFSTEDATFAVDSLDIDYNEQAAISAQSYLDTVGGFSRQGLIDQLLYEGFTQEQAEYGVDQVGL